MLMSREHEDAVVSRIGGIDITRVEMRCYFARVAPQELGAPIDCKIYVACDFDLLAIHRAVEIYTGHKPTLNPLPDPTSRLGCRYHIQAPAPERNLLHV